MHDTHTHKHTHTQILTHSRIHKHYITHNNHEKGRVYVLTRECVFRFNPCLYVYRYAHLVFVYTVCVSGHNVCTVVVCSFSWTQRVRSCKQKAVNSMLCFRWSQLVFMYTRRVRGSARRCARVLHYPCKVSVSECAFPLSACTLHAGLYQRSYNLRAIHIRPTVNQTAFGCTEMIIIRFDWGVQYRNIKNTFIQLEVTNELPNLYHLRIIPVRSQPMVGTQIIGLLPA